MNGSHLGPSRSALFVIGSVMLAYASWPRWWWGVAVAVVSFMLGWLTGPLLRRFR